MLTVNKVANEETPDGLHRMQYAVGILENQLGWPAKGNAELIADCILSVSKSRHLTLKQAHDYLARAIRLAKEQCVEVDRFFFMEGKYTLIRPEAKDKTREFHAPTQKEIEAAKKDRESLFASPEWQQTITELNEKFGCSQRKVVVTAERRAELKAQAERLQSK